MNSHIVDIYEVPCASGPVRLFVCIYHCPDGRSPMGEAPAAGPEGGTHTASLPDPAH